MNDQDYIRKGVELADQWAMHSDQTFGMSSTIFLLTSQIGCDALAAQLVKQVDKYIENSDRNLCFEITAGHAAVRSFERDDTSTKGIIRYSKVSASYSDDRTMNAIKAIVDSGVLS